MIYLSHRGSTLSFKTMHPDNEKQGIPTPRAQSPFYFLRNKELRHETSQRLPTGAVCGSDFDDPA